MIALCPCTVGVIAVEIGPSVLTSIERDALAVQPRHRWLLACGLEVLACEDLIAKAPVGAIWGSNPRG